MIKYLIPRIDWNDLLPMFRVAFLGALIGGFYGIAHDQMTYTIGPEYFTRMKFNQFQYANFGFGDRYFVSTIGFLATWWVGFFVAWFLARRHIPNQVRKTALRKIWAGFVTVLFCGLLAGAMGYGYGVWRGPDADYSAWIPLIRRFNISDTYAFMRVAYIHNASYLGGFVGLIIAIVFIRPEPLE